MKKLIAISLTFAPLLVAAAATLESILQQISHLVSLLVPLLITLAVVYFIWGVIKYIAAGGDEEKRKEARSMMIYGIIGLFVIVAMWGLVEVLRSTFGINAEQTYTTPWTPIK